MRSDRRRRLFDRRGALLPGSAEFEVIHRRAGASLRYYAPAAIDEQTTRPRNPLVLVPPLGVATRRYDRRREHGLVAYLSARGFDLYLIDWGWPTRADDGRHLADYFAALLPEMLNRVRFHSGRTALSLHGWRLGGVFALCCAAISSPGEISRLVLLDTAIDYQAVDAPGGLPAPVWQRARQWQRLTGLRAAHLPVTLLHAPGWARGLARRASHGRLRRVTDDDFLFSRAYPGGVVADIIDYLWSDNALAHGRLPMVGANTGLDAVGVPILYLCGRTRPVCSPGCGQRLTDVVGSPEVVCEWIESDADAAIGGALGARQSWGQIADWLIAEQ